MVAWPMRKPFFVPLLLLCVPCFGALVVDQSNTASTGLASAIWATGSGVESAQTYTAGISGNLAAVSLETQGGSAAFPLVISIYSTTGGLPSALLTRFTHTSHAVSLADLILLPAPILQQAGEQYALAVNYAAGATPGFGFLNGGLGAGYTGGTALVLDGLGWRPTGAGIFEGDLYFRTHVNDAAVPEPATWTLLVAAGGLLLKRRRR